MESPGLFPYPFRSGQRDLVEVIRDGIASRKSVVMESGTGTGKTVCSLTGALEDQPCHGFKTVYLTRTKSQQKQVMTEMREINKRRPIFAVAIQGRNASTCPMIGTDPELGTGTPDELSKWCSEMKRKGEEGGCPYFCAIEGIDVEGFVMEMRRTLPDPESFQRRCVEKNVCPYEMGKMALQYADVVCAPYPFVLTHSARMAFLQWIGTPLNELVIIVDEAHNIPDYLREISTSKYSVRALDLAEKEVMEYGDPTLLDGISASDFINVLRGCFSEAVSEFVTDEDGPLPPYFMEEWLMSELRTTSIGIGKICKALIDLGEAVADRKRSQRRLPRSYARSLGTFIQSWMACDEMCYAKLVNGGENPSFEAYCMDPYDAAEPFRTCRSSIHMSGTLEPLAEYAEELGLDDAVIRNFPSPFDPRNLLSLYVDDVTTKYDDLEAQPEIFDRLEAHVHDIVCSVRRNTAVFFPSYSMISRFISDGVLEGSDRGLYFERRDMDQTELMDAVNDFRGSDGNVLFAVAGGRISEGLDFPDRDLEVVIIVGVPYPYPTFRQRSLVRYVDARVGRGWEHAVRSPTVRKMRQARGRLIRSETDRGICIVLDRRIGAIQGFDAVLCEDVPRAIREFFGE